MKKFFVTILAAVIFAASFCIVSADALIYQYEVGEDIWVVIAGSKSADDPISRLYDVQGLPAGVTLTVCNGWQIVMQGRSMQSGVYPFTYSFNTRNNGEVHTAVADTLEIMAPEVELIKIPGSETVTEHGSALFVSAATNYSTAEWRLVDREDNAYVGTEAMKERFHGLLAEAYRGSDGREYLQLDNIPLEMNDYLVITEFHNLDGTDSAFTPYEACGIFVQEKRTAKPIIDTQPVGAELKPGTAMRLEIAADCAEGTLCYQWYRNTVESTENGLAISGANTDRYVPEKNPGTTYYYCALWASADGKASETVYSDIVRVTYLIDDAQPVQTPVQNAQEKDVSELIPPEGEKEDENKETNPIIMKLKQMEKADLIGIIGIAVLLVISGSVLIILNRRENR